MKITFFNPSNFIVNYGLRVIAAYLIQNGFDAEIDFLIQPDVDPDFFYSPEEIEDLVKRAESSDIIGFSFTTGFFVQARALSRIIKERTGKLIVWGGVHATAMPRECLEYCDIVVSGEGEEALLDIMLCAERGEEISDIPGTSLVKNGIFKTNPVRPYERNADKYPPPLYDFDKTRINRNGRIVRMDEAVHREFFRTPAGYYSRDELYGYLTMTARGCPFDCAYCCNNLYSSLYGDRSIRSRSGNAIIEELKEIIRKFPYVGFIEFFDDDFIVSRGKTLDKFLEDYKREIGLPFRICATPAVITSDKLDALYSAGLRHIEMGLQSASEETNRNLYNRPFKPDKFLKTAELILAKGINLYIDVITDNPYEPMSAKIETVRFLSRITKPVNLSVFSLTFYPGTLLFSKAISDGLIKDFESEVCRKRDNHMDYVIDPYVKFLIFLFRTKNKGILFSKLILDFFSSRAAVSIFGNHAFDGFWRALLKLKNRLGNG